MCAHGWGSWASLSDEQDQIEEPANIGGFINVQSFDMEKQKADTQGSPGHSARGPSPGQAAPPQAPLRRQLRPIGLVQEAVPGGVRLQGRHLHRPERHQPEVRAGGGGPH